MPSDAARGGGEPDGATPVDRLTAIGLPPRSIGWVPEQPGPVLGGVRSKIEPPTQESGAGLVPDSILDSLRLALAARTPDWLAARLDRMSARAFGSAVAALIGLAVVAGIAIHRHDSGSYPASYDPPDASAPAAPPPAFSDGSSIVVDVAGKVRHPGLVTLPVGARVADAIKAAGGALRHRDLDGVDLAQRVTDGELLSIGKRKGHGAAGAASKLVDLSTASLARLETLPGVGPVTAQKIIAWRTAHGGFTSVSELQQVSGIGPARYAELSPLVAP